MTEEGLYRVFLEQAWHKVRVGVEATGTMRYFKGRMEAAGMCLKK
jgi:hypothetical protein